VELDTSNMYPDTEPFVIGYKCGKWKARTRYKCVHQESCSHTLSPCLWVQQ